MIVNSLARDMKLSANVTKRSPAVDLSFNDSLPNAQRSHCFGLRDPLVTNPEPVRDRIQLFQALALRIGRLVKPAEIKLGDCYRPGRLVKAQNSGPPFYFVSLNVS
jgi:hypothetical protein